MLFLLICLVYISFICDIHLSPRFCIDLLSTHYISSPPLLLSIIPYIPLLFTYISILLTTHTNPLILHTSLHLWIQPRGMVVDRQLSNSGGLQCLHTFSQILFKAFANLASFSVASPAVQDWGHQNKAWILLLGHIATPYTKMWQRRYSSGLFELFDGHVGLEWWMEFFTFAQFSFSGIIIESEKWVRGGDWRNEQDVNVTVDSYQGLNFQRWTIAKEKPSLKKINNSAIYVSVEPMYQLVF